MLNAGMDWREAAKYLNIAAYARRKELEKYGGLPYISFENNRKKIIDEFGNVFQQAFYFVNSDVVSVAGRENHKGRVSSCNLDHKDGGGWLAYGDNYNKHFGYKRTDAFIFEFSENMESLKIAVFEMQCTVKQQIYQAYKAGLFAMIPKKDRLYI
jgi:hypothetical protein